MKQAAANENAYLHIEHVTLKLYDYSMKQFARNHYKQILDLIELKNNYKQTIKIFFF